MFLAEIDVGPFFLTQLNPTQPTKLIQGPNPTHPLGAHMQKYVATKCSIQITVSSSVIIVPNQ